MTLDSYSSDQSVSLTTHAYHDQGHPSPLSKFHLTIFYHEAAYCHKRVSVTVRVRVSVWVRVMVWGQDEVKTENQKV